MSRLITIRLGCYYKVPSAVNSSILPFIIYPPNHSSPFPLSHDALIQLNDKAVSHPLTIPLLFVCSNQYWGYEWFVYVYPWYGRVGWYGQRLCHHTEQSFVAGGGQSRLFKLLCPLLQSKMWVLCNRLIWYLNINCNNLIWSICRA